jgi:hypothetical protein
MTSIDEVGPYPPEPERIRFITCNGCEATVTQRPNAAGRWTPLICTRCGILNRESAREWMARRALLGEAA